MALRNELTIDTLLQLTRLFGMKGAFSACIHPLASGLTIRSGPLVTMPRNRKCIVERIIEALCDKLIDRPAGKYIRSRGCLFRVEKLSLPIDWRDLVQSPRSLTNFELRY